MVFNLLKYYVQLFEILIVNIKGFTADVEALNTLKNVDCMRVQVLINNEHIITAQSIV